MHRIKMKERTTEILIVLTILLGVTKAAQKTLPEDGTLGDLAWKTLLRAGQAKSDQERDTPLPNRRITTKSLFIAPQIGLESIPDCPDGHRVNSKGDCVKVINLDQTAHLEFLLQKLNSQYATEEVKEESYDYDIEVPENTGPFQYNIPLPFQMNGPKPEDSEGSIDTYVLTKKEIKNPDKDMTLNKHEYPELVSDDDEKQQFFLGEISELLKKSSVENTTNHEISMHKMSVDNEVNNNGSSMGNLTSPVINTNITNYLALESELELLKLHSTSNNKQVNSSKASSTIKPLNSSQFPLEIVITNGTGSNQNQFNTINIVTSTDNSLLINKTHDSIPYLTEETPINNSSNLNNGNFDGYIKHNNNISNDNLESKNLTDDFRLNNNTSEIDSKVLNPNNTLFDKGSPESVDFVVTNNVENSNTTSFNDSNSRDINKEEGSGISNNLGNDKDAMKNESNVDIPPNPSIKNLLDIIKTDPDIKLDNKIKIISQIADVTTDDIQIKMTSENVDEKNRSEILKDSVADASAPISSNYVNPHGHIRDTEESDAENDKPVTQRNYLEYQILHRRPYWWLPASWEVKPSNERNQLMDFWSRMPLVMDPSFNYPYMRRPQRHYIPYQHSLYPHPQMSKPLPDFERPIYNYRTARHYHGNNGDPFFDDHANINQWDSYRARTQR